MKIAMSLQLHIEKFCLGEWMTNCYVVHKALTQPGGGNAPTDCWIVDAGFGPDAMIQYIKDNQLTPRQVLLTHAHVDHIAGVGAVREHWPDVPILIHENERRFLTDPMLNLSVALPEPVTAPEATGTLEHGQRLSLDGIEFEVRYTPGHSPGSVSLYQAEAGIILAGDVLFLDSIGRTDFPNCNHEHLLESIRTQFYTLPDETRVLPGHGPETTIGHERANNPFVQG